MEEAELAYARRGPNLGLAEVGLEVESGPIDGRRSAIFSVRAPWACAQQAWTCNKWVAVAAHWGLTDTLWTQVLSC